MREIEGWWEDWAGESVFCLGILSLDDGDENLEPLEGFWSRDSLPKLADLAAQLGVRIKNPEQGWFLDEKFH